MTDYIHAHAHAVDSTSLQSERDQRYPDLQRNSTKSLNKDTNNQPAKTQMQERRFTTLEPGVRIDKHQEVEKVKDEFVFHSKKNYD
jgi:hypothetical protein